MPKQQKASTTKSKKIKDLIMGPDYVTPTKPIKNNKPYENRAAGKKRAQTNR